LLVVAVVVVALHTLVKEVAAALVDYCQVLWLSLPEYRIVLL
jgi:hypothetical protein